MLFTLNFEHTWWRLFQIRIVGITFLLVRKDMDVNEHERLSNITLVHKVKEQFFY
jgi:hypothetical protein